MACASVLLCPIYGDEQYADKRARSGMEKRQRRATGPLPARGSTAPRLRRFEADPAPLRRGPELPCHVALPPPAPAGENGLDRGPLGREAGAAPPPLLQPDRAGPKGASFETAELAGLRGRHQPHHGD